VQKYLVLSANLGSHAVRSAIGSPPKFFEE
jgi:hypothetical protein